MNEFFLLSTLVSYPSILLELILAKLFLFRFFTSIYNNISLKYYISLAGISPVAFASIWKPWAVFRFYWFKSSRLFPSNVTIANEMRLHFGEMFLQYFMLVSCRRFDRCFSCIFILCHRLIVVRCMATANWITQRHKKRISKQLKQNSREIKWKKKLVDLVRNIYWKYAIYFGR